MKSRAAIVDSADWEIAIFLPVESFRKSSLATIYADSKRMISQSKG